MKNVSFIGNPSAEYTVELKEKLLDTCRTLIEQGATDFYAGGDRGFDILSECVVLMLKEDYPQIRLHLVYPCPEDEQTRGWDFLNFALHFYAAKCADSKEVCAVFDDCCQRLVDYADCCVCYYNEGNFSLGTAQTVRMAAKKGIEVINLYQ